MRGFRLRKETAMKKTLASVLSGALLSSLFLAGTLALGSGCVVRPAGYGYGYHHHHHYSRW